jgi:hypothetical protein
LTRFASTVTLTDTEFLVSPYVRPVTICHYAVELCVISDFEKSDYEEEKVSDVQAAKIILQIQVVERIRQSAIRKEHRREILIPSGTLVILHIVHLVHAIRLSETSENFYRNVLHHIPRENTLRNYYFLMYYLKLIYVGLEAFSGDAYVEILHM